MGSHQPSLPFEMVISEPRSAAVGSVAPGSPDQSPVTSHQPLSMPPAPSPQPPVPSPQPPVPSHPFLFVRHPRARRYLIRVTGDGTVRVTVPRRGSKREAEAFAVQQRAWIEKQWRRVQVEQSKPRPAPLAPEVEREWRAQAKQTLPARLLELASLHGLTVTRVSIRNQRRRWGSCSRSGHICLNWRLAQMPAPVRDYVLIHELMHLKRMDHSPAFWTLVERACPGYKDARAWLLGHARETR